MWEYLKVFIIGHFIVGYSVALYAVLAMTYDYNFVIEFEKSYLTYVNYVRNLENNNTILTIEEYRIIVIILFIFFGYANIFELMKIFSKGDDNE